MRRWNFSQLLFLALFLWAWPAYASSSPPQAYCEALHEFEDLYTVAADKFPDWSERQEWLQPRIEKINEKVSSAVGVDYFEWSATAAEEGWSDKCAAKESGRVIVTVDDLKAATEDDREIAEDFIELHYILRLKRGGDRFFDPDRYGAVNCAADAIDGLQVIGCKLRAFGAETDRDCYLVARVQDRPVLVPLDGEARSRMEGIKVLRESTLEDHPELLLGHVDRDLSFVDYVKIREVLD